MAGRHHKSHRDRRLARWILLAVQICLVVIQSGEAVVDLIDRL